MKRLKIILLAIFLLALTYQGYSQWDGYTQFVPIEDLDTAYSYNIQFFTTGNYYAHSGEEYCLENQQEYGNLSLYQYNNLQIMNADQQDNPTYCGTYLTQKYFQLMGWYEIFAGNPQIGQTATITAIIWDLNSVAVCYPYWKIQIVEGDISINCALSNLVIDAVSAIKFKPGAIITPSTTTQLGVWGQDSYCSGLKSAKVHISNNADISAFQNLGNTTPISSETINALKVVPNPTNDRIFVEGLTDFEADIFDLSGRNVLSVSKTNGSIDMSGLNPGIYILQLKSAGKTYVQKVVKQ
jgi:hypothetical protein